MSSPTSRSLDELRKNGWTAQVVERWNQYAHVRQDLFGCIDILAIKPGHKPLGVQATTGEHHAHRRAKALDEPRLLTWLAAGCAFEVWSWEKQGARGKRKIWTLRREEITGVQVLNEKYEEPKARAG